MMDDEICVCGDCFDDEGIKDFVADNATSRRCSFCGKRAKRPVAAPLDEVVKLMRSGLSDHYDEAANWLPFESAEGGYQGIYWDTQELLCDEVGLVLPNDDAGILLGDICDRLGRTDWCQRNPFSLGPNDKLRYSWEEFCRTIKFERRFFFLNGVQHPTDNELLNPGEILDSISDYADSIGLMRVWPACSRVFRARRRRPGQELNRAKDLGPPPGTKQSNRMSPPGIVMFYGSDGAETAVREIAQEPGSFVVGEFEILRGVTILDLANLPSIPSLFAPIPDSLEYDPRQRLMFLHQVAREISKPIARDNRVHIEYVPTQVLTEYFRCLTLSNGRGVDGIRYSSARDRRHASVVLFATQDDLVVENETRTHLPRLGRDPWLRLEASSSFEVTSLMLQGWRSEIPDWDIVD